MSTYAFCPPVLQRLQVLTTPWRDTQYRQQPQQQHQTASVTSVNCSNTGGTTITTTTTALNVALCTSTVATAPELNQQHNCSNPPDAGSTVSSLVLRQAGNSADLSSKAAQV